MGKGMVPMPYNAKLPVPNSNILYITVVQFLILIALSRLGLLLQLQLTLPKTATCGLVVVCLYREVAAL